MNCFFDPCEFINIIVGGILTGIVASFLFVLILNTINSCRDSRNYKYLQSPNENEFDWICYSMQYANGRIREENPNGSTANINYKKGNILNIRIKQKDNRIWKGKITMIDKYVGTLFFRYENEHEYGSKDVYIGEHLENGKKYDSIFLFGKDKDYGNELLIRDKNK